MSALEILEGYDPSIDWETHPEQRRTFVGASDAAAVMGLDPYRSPVDVWLDKLGRHPAPFKGNDATEFGHRAEPFIAKWVSDLHDDWQLVEPEGRSWRHPEIDCIVATPDRFVVGGTLLNTDMEMGLVECKTTTWRLAHLWENDAPDQYVIQAHVQMMCTGTRWVQLACLIDRGLVEYRVDYDDGLGAYIRDCLLEFWGHVQNQTEPPLVGHPNEFGDLQHVWTPRDTTVEVDSSLVAEYLDAKARQEEAKRDLSTAKAAIAAQMKEASIAQVDGETVITWNPRTELDVDAIRKHEPAALLECTHPQFDAAMFRDKHPDLARKYRREVGRTMREAS